MGFGVFGFMNRDAEASNRYAGYARTAWQEMKKSGKPELETVLERGKGKSLTGSADEKMVLLHIVSDAVQGRASQSALAYHSILAYPRPEHLKRFAIAASEVIMTPGFNYPGTLGKVFAIRQKDHWRITLVQGSFHAHDTVLGLGLNNEKLRKMYAGWRKRALKSMLKKAVLEQGVPLLVDKPHPSFAKGLPGDLRKAAKELGLSVSEGEKAFTIMPTK